MSESYPDVTVYGATGHTGQLVCRELADRGRDFVAGGRNLERLQKLSTELGETRGVMPTLRQADVRDWDSLMALLADTEVLINCAGPFVDLGPPVARAAVRHDVHYLDTTGEQEYIRWLEDELDVEARRRRVALMPSCAFEYATGMLAAALAIEASARSIVVSYGVSGFETSAGTKQSILRSIADRGVTFERGRRVPRRAAETTYRVPHPGGGEAAGVWFPGGEPILLPRMADVDRAESCIRVGSTTAAWLSALSGWLGPAARWAEPVVDRIIDWVHDERDRGDVDEGAVPFEVVAFDPDAGEWLAEVSGYDPYPTTASIIVEAAARLDDREDPDGGLQSPPALFDARDFAESTGLRVEVAGG